MEICGIEVVADHQTLVEAGALTLAFLEEVRARRIGRKPDDAGGDEPEEVAIVG